MQERIVERRKPGLRQFRQLSRELFLRDALSRYVDDATAEALSRNLRFVWKHYPDRYGQINEAERAAYKAYLKWMEKPDNRALKEKCEDELERCQYVYSVVIDRFYRAQEEAHK